MLEKLIVLVEEPSMEAALSHVLPKLLRETDFEIMRFQGKQDLLRNLPARLSAYKRWLPSNWAILVLIDRDDEDCITLKQTLEEITARAGLISKTNAGHGRPFQVANRITVEELEAWFFGDWAAVQASFPKVPTTVPQKARFRDPDAISDGTWEAFERILKQAGPFKSGLRKIECARQIAPHMEPARNTSHSFQAFCRAVVAARDSV